MFTISWFVGAIYLASQSVRWTDLAKEHELLQEHIAFSTIKASCAATSVSIPALHYSGYDATCQLSWNVREPPLKSHTILTYNRAQIILSDLYTMQYNK